MKGVHRNLMKYVYAAAFAAVVMKCAADSVSSTSTPYTTTIDPICGYLPDGSYVAHPYNCSKFYECNNGIAFEQSCPPGTLWSEEELACDYPQNVTCRVTTFYPQSPTTLDPICGGQPDGALFGDAYNCSAFYECLAGFPVLQGCPPNTQWNQQILQCDDPFAVNCTALTYPPTLPTAEPAALICADQFYGSYVPHPSDEQKLYVCVDDEAFELACPEDSVWNQEKETCIYY